MIGSWTNLRVLFLRKLANERERRRNGASERRNCLTPLPPSRSWLLLLLKSSLLALESGGLSLAVALWSNGLTASLWERAPKLREIGAGLLLTPNAVWILQKLGIFSETCAVGRIVQRWQILDPRQRVLQTFDHGTQDLPSISITRSAFQRLLLSKLPPETVSLE